MIVDYALSKPRSAAGYSLHRIVEGLTEDARPLFADMGDRVLVRSARPINGVEPMPVRQLAEGDVAAFQLRASVCKKTQGKRSYYPTGDWPSRHKWLKRQGEQHGFNVLTVHCTAERAKIEKAGRPFTVDRTDFTGVLEVTDAEKFRAALREGVTGCGKAFGFGMLLV